MTLTAAPRRAARRTEPTIRDVIHLAEQMIRADRDEHPTVPGWCARCDQPWRLPIGPGGELCTPCLAAEYADRQIGRRRG